MLLDTAWAIQSAPSGPAAMPCGSPVGVTGNSLVTTPAVVRRPATAEAPSGDVYQRAPSEPVVMSHVVVAGTLNVTAEPAGVTLPICPPKSVTQMFASGPSVRLRTLK